MYEGGFTSQLTVHCHSTPASFPSSHRRELFATNSPYLLLHSCQITTLHSARTVLHRPFSPSQPLHRKRRVSRRVHTIYILQSFAPTSRKLLALPISSFQPPRRGEGPEYAPQSPTTPTTIPHERLQPSTDDIHPHERYPPTSLNPRFQSRTTTFSISFPRFAVTKNRRFASERRTL